MKAHTKILCRKSSQYSPVSNRSANSRVSCTTTKSSTLRHVPRYQQAGFWCCKLTWYHDLLLVPYESSSFCTFRFAAECHPSGLCNDTTSSSAIWLFFCIFLHYLPTLPSLPLLTCFWAFCMFYKTSQVWFLILSAFPLLFLSMATASPSLPLHCCCQACHYPLFLTCLTKRL